jgi:hypothetical protein
MEAAAIGRHRGRGSGPPPRPPRRSLVDPRRVALPHPDRRWVTITAGEPELSVGLRGGGRALKPGQGPPLPGIAPGRCAAPGAKHRTSGSGVGSDPTDPFAIATTSERDIARFPRENVTGM